MRVFFAACGTLLFSAFVLLAGSGLMFGLLPLRARVDGFSDASIGLLGSAYFVGMLLGCLVAPTMIRSVGHIRVYAAVAALSTAMPLGHALFPEPVAWALMRATSGFCLAVAFAIIESWLNERATNTIRGAVLAFYNIINFGAMAFGQQLMRLYQIEGFQLFSIAAILVAIAAVPVALTRTVAPTPPETVNLRPIWLFRLSPVAFVGCLGVGLVNGAFWSLSPVFVTARGLDTAGVADFFSAVVLGGVIALFPLGRLSDRIDRRIVLAACGAIGAASGLVLALVSAGPSEYWLLLGLAVAFGIGAMPLYAIGGANANDYAQTHELVDVATGLLLVYTLGAICGPLIVSLAMGRFGADALFVFTAVVHLLCAAYALWRITRRAAIDVDDRDPFAPTPRTSPVAAELSPLVHEEGDAEAVAEEPADEHLNAEPVEVR